MPEGDAPGIHVLAGPNGAGKSSIAGRAIKQAGGRYLNPDEATRELLAEDPSLGLEQANSESWFQMVRLLERAIERREAFVFETTLGGSTITGLLLEAARQGIDVHIWYVALATPELHIERVARRVAGGGHDIPEALIRSRYDSSRLNLVRLLPVVAQLLVFDNSASATPGDAAGEPEPLQVLHVERGAIVDRCSPDEVPAWAKAIMAAALGLAGPS